MGEQGIRSNGGGQTVLESVQAETGERTDSAKEKLLEAADLFAKTSYSEVGIARILEWAGFHAPTLYYHFGDKEGLYVAWALRSIEELGEAVRSKLEGLDETRSGLTALATCVSDPFRPDLSNYLRDASRLERSESREKIVDAVHRAVYEPLYALLLTGMERRELRLEPVQKTATVFLAGALALRPGGPLSSGEDPASEWWVERFFAGFGA